MENKILFDWLSFTCKTKRVDINGILIEKIDERNLVELLGLVDVPWEELPGVKGFKNRMYFEVFQFIIIQMCMIICGLK